MRIRVLAVLTTLVVAVAGTVVGVTVWRALTRGDTPPVPSIAAAKELGTLRQHPRVNGRDDGQSTRYGDQSIWVFGDTVVKNPWSFVGSTGAATKDLHAADGVTLTSTDIFGTSGSVPTALIPFSPSEEAFTAAHALSTGCTAVSDPYCGGQMGLWPGAVLADPARQRVLILYNKLCRGGLPGTQCTGTLGHALGTGIASVDMKTHTVTRLRMTGAPVLHSVDGDDPTLFFGPSTSFTAAAVLQGDDVYFYGACHSRCQVARVPAGAIRDLSQWQYFSGRDSDGKASWTPDEPHAAGNISAGSAGNSVYWVPALKAWLNVYLPPLSNTLTAQVGASPAGPWSQAFVLFNTDNAGGAANYAGFGHPEYAERNGLVQYFSYYQEATYQQRLVRVVFRK